MALICGSESFEGDLNDRISPKLYYHSRLDVPLIDNDRTIVVWTEKVMSVTIVPAWQLLVAAQPLDGVSTA